MRKIFAISIIILGQSLSVRSQAIDNKNYYNFQKPGASFNWLRASDAVPVIIHELLKNGIAYHTIGVGELIKINDSTRFVATVSFEKGDKQYGFLYEPTHGVPLNPKDRDFLKDRRKADYVQAETDTKNDVNFMRIDPIPGNIFLLKQTCYWFQFDAARTIFPVSKDVAQNILRQDIREYLKKL